MKEDNMKIELGNVSLSLSYDNLNVAKNNIGNSPLLIQQISDGEGVEISLDEARWLIENLELYIHILSE